jgi:hypothetical protein
MKEAYGNFKIEISEFLTQGDRVYVRCGKKALTSAKSRASRQPINASSKWRAQGGRPSPAIPRASRLTRLLPNDKIMKLLRI